MLFTLFSECIPGLWLIIWDVREIVWFWWMYYSHPVLYTDENCLDPVQNVERVLSETADFVCEFHTALNFYNTKGILHANSVL